MTGAACVLVETAAGGGGLDGFGGVVDALAPDLLADALVVAPTDGLETRMVGGADPPGLTLTDEGALLAGLTFTEAGALTCGLTGATWAATDVALSAPMTNKIKVNALERTIVGCDTRHLLRCGSLESADVTPMAVTASRRCASRQYKAGYAAVTRGIDSW
jgi:hypothetical protein